MFPSVLLSYYFTLIWSIFYLFFYIFSLLILILFCCLAYFWLLHFHSLVCWITLFFFVYCPSTFFISFIFYLYLTSCLQVWTFWGLQAPIQVTQHALVCSLQFLIYKCSASQDHRIPFIVHHPHWFTLDPSPHLLLPISLTVFTAMAYSSAWSWMQWVPLKCWYRFTECVVCRHILENSKHQ
jgi:hypothetical protein